MENFMGTWWKSFPGRVTANTKKNGGEVEEQEMRFRQAMRMQRPL